VPALAGALAQQAAPSASRAFESDPRDLAAHVVAILADETGA